MPGLFHRSAAAFTPAILAQGVQPGRNTEEGNIEGVHGGRLGDGRVYLTDDFNAALAIAFHRSQQISGSGGLVLKLETDLGRTKDVGHAADTDWQSEGFDSCTSYILPGLDMVSSGSMRSPILAG